MLKITTIALLLLSLSFIALPSGGAALLAAEPQNAPESRVVPSLKYCALIEGSRRYSDKLVRVSASWQFGFEKTFLFDPKCPERPGAWLEFPEDAQTCPETKTNREAPGPHDKEADVTLTGKLFGPGNYGHLGAYQYKFVVTCLEKIKITASDLK